MKYCCRFCDRPIDTQYEEYEEVSRMQKYGNSGDGYWFVLCKNCIEEFDDAIQEIIETKKKRGTK